MKFRPEGAELRHADGQTDSHDMTLVVDYNGVNLLSNTTMWWREIYYIIIT